MPHTSSSVPRKRFGLHARVTAELPFRLGAPTGIHLLRLYPTNAALPIIVLTTSSWVLGFQRGAIPEVLREPDFVARTSATTEELQEIAHTIKAEGLDRAVLVPTGTMLQLRIPMEPDPPADLREWAFSKKARRLYLLYFNEFLLRYQVACGFAAAAGVSAVSELDLRHLHVQFYEDDLPKTDVYTIVSAVPGQSVQGLRAPPPDTAQRLDIMMMAPMVPLWLAIAHTANALLHRRSYEQAIVAWVQSLEIGVKQMGLHLDLKGTKGRPVEERLALMLEQHGYPTMPSPLLERLKRGRQMRNAIIHEGLGRWVEDGEIEDIADAFMDALILLERLGIEHLPPQPGEPRVSDPSP